MKRTWKYLALLSLPLLVIGLSVEAQSAMEGNPARGASLFESCAPCHTYTGKGVAGLPEETLMQKMQQYQTGTFDNPKVQSMQKVLQPMSQQDLLDLAAYISKM